MSQADNIHRWQQEFKAQPRIWYTEDSEGHVCNFYESKEAAQLEVEWSKGRRWCRSYLMSRPIHSMKLSRERWCSGTAFAEERDRRRQG